MKLLLVLMLAAAHQFLGVPRSSSESLGGATTAQTGEHDHCAPATPRNSEEPEEPRGTNHTTPWTPAAERKPLQNLDIPFKDQDGRDGVLGKVIDKPVLVTFFYTRCQNSKKCSMAVTRLTGLQRQLAKAGIDDRVRLLAISYEPQFDTPERLHRYATDRGLQPTPNALLLQLDAARNQNLVDQLNAPANYNAGWINTHGVELTLLDAHGRPVRKYHTVLWNNEQVIADVQRVLAEQ
ncbi:MAG TPA: SCO family protein [Thermoanaerobaculia bacterium]|nr:SCO family protein [Thermoanaerobaculia bacterium]